ncbi:hypothetical protein B0T10DRAFT_501045 [Thelonectria olida]|uniref:Uncharacterized protein n=1 Tax=Thelonectria olida TaxID=1576542 RepID=A0A9P8VQZ2_9HYPO|nr:hypothetical protein B0T10DRAFT_501045 [Thelonectria olida]
MSSGCSRTASTPVLSPVVRPARLAVVPMRLALRQKSMATNPTLCRAVRNLLNCAAAGGHIVTPGRARSEGVPGRKPVFSQEFTRLGCAWREAFNAAMRSPAPAQSAYAPSSAPSSNLTTPQAERSLVLSGSQLSPIPFPLPAASSQRAPQQAIAALNQLAISFQHNLAQLSQQFADADTARVFRKTAIESARISREEAVENARIAREEEAALRREAAEDARERRTQQLIAAIAGTPRRPRPRRRRRSASPNNELVEIEEDDVVEDEELFK